MASPGSCPIALLVYSGRLDSRARSVIRKGGSWWSHFGWSPPPLAALLPKCTSLPSSIAMSRKLIAALVPGLRSREGVKWAISSFPTTGRVPPQTSQGLHV